MPISFNNAAAVVKRTRLQRKCPSCGKLIIPGDFVTPDPKHVGARKRWKHVDCDAVKDRSADAKSGADDEARQAAKEAQAEAKRLKLALVAMVQRLDELEARTPKRVEIRVNDVPKVELDGVAHAAFPTVFALAVQRKPIFLAGPTGCGKTHLAKQLADALQLPFDFVSCSIGMSESQLTGRLLPLGEQGQFQYVMSKFVDRYENGGVFLFDELDAADPNILLAINAALANGVCAVPNRPGNPVAKQHKDFVAIAGANTWGTGADRLFVGRTQLDESTLDRFRIGQVNMDYDAAVEQALVTYPGLYQRLHAYRVRIREAKLQRSMSTRFMRDASDMMHAGWTFDDVDRAFFSGWREDEIRKVKDC